MPSFKYLNGTTTVGTGTYKFKYLNPVVSGYTVTFDVTSWGNNGDKIKYSIDNGATWSDDIYFQSSLPITIQNVTQFKLYVVYTNTSYSNGLTINGVSMSGFDNTNYTITQDSTIIYQGSDCLVKGTKITLSNYTTKNVEDITYEDTLLVWDFDKACLSAAKPLWIRKNAITGAYNLLTFEDGSTLGTVNQHRIFNKEKGMFTYPMTDDTPIGTTTYSLSGYVKLTDKEVVQKSTDYYNIITDYHVNLFANGILTSCRYSNIYPIKDMKYVKDNRALIPFSAYSVSEKYYKGLRLSEQLIDIEQTNKYIKHLEEGKI